MKVQEIVKYLLRDRLDLLRRHPKHPKVLKELGLDNLPPQSIVIVGRNHIEILVPAKANSETS